MTGSSAFHPGFYPVYPVECLFKQDGQDIQDEKIRIKEIRKHCDLRVCSYPSLLIAIQRAALLEREEGVEA